MDQEKSIIQTRLTTPRAAAIAGILFSILLIASLVLVRISVPANPQDVGTWLSVGWRNIKLALNLLPFAGIAFLWFIGVVRDRLGQQEDRFFATVFLGSGLLYLAMLFNSGSSRRHDSLWLSHGSDHRFRHIQFRAYGNLRDYECLR